MKRRRKKPQTRRWVIDKLRARWSPQQIAGRSKIDGPQSVSHEYVYTLIHRDKKRGSTLHRVLKRFGKRKQRIAERICAKAPADADVYSFQRRPTLIANQWVRFR